MLHFNGSFVGECIIWELGRFDDTYKDDGVMISFHPPYQLPEREAINYLKAHLPEEEKRWLSFTSRKWTLDLTLFKAYFYDGLVRMLQEQEHAEPSEDVIYLDLAYRHGLQLNYLKESWMSCQNSVIATYLKKQRPPSILFSTMNS